MKLYRNLCEAVIAGLQEIFDEKKYADKVIEKILKSNPRWGARDRRFIAETIYDIVRWYRLFRELANAEENEYWKLLAVWCLWNKTEFPDWEEMKGVDRKKVLARYEEVKSERKIRESIPDWMDELGEKEVGANWTTELEALNEEASVVLRTNT
ncbi:MAG: RNA methyltransferase, partial [Cyclobacteriaceae bacterium]|nr:RNA methyltransferase [Cyclobacteriaceae bacterium]